MDIHRAVLPVVVGVAATAVLATGAVTSGGLRADRAQRESEERAAAAAALVSQKERDYREAVRPLAEVVFDEVQPLQAAFDAFEQDASYDQAVRDDVFEHGGAGKALTGHQGRLGALAAPPALTDDAEDLSAALDTLIGAARVLDKATRAPGDDDGFVQEYDDGERALGRGIQSWTDALGALYAGAAVTPIVPVYGAASRAAHSKGAYLYFVDRACGRAGRAFNALPEPDDGAEALRVLRKQAALIRSTSARLKAVPLPSADADRLERHVRAPLHEFASGADALDALVRALQERDREAAAAALTRGRRADAAQARLAAGFQRYGATVCSEALAVASPPSGGGSTDDTVTA